MLKWWLAIRIVFCSYQSTDLIPYIHRIFLPYFPQILKPPSWIPYNPPKNALKLVKTKQDQLKVQAELSLCGRHWLSNQQFQGSWVAREKNRNFLHWHTIYSWAFLGHILYGKTQKKKDVQTAAWWISSAKTKDKLECHIPLREKLSPSAVLFLLCTVRNKKVN